MNHETARVEISARLDEEINEATAHALDEHLAACNECRAHEADLRRVRRALRVQVVDDVPDLTNAIMSRVQAEARRAPARRDWAIRLRVGSIAAAAAALLVLGASLPFVERPADSAGASEIARQVRAAARTLHTYRASFDITERGWHPRFKVRRFSAEVSYEAPENFRLAVRDLTPYPGSRWPRNKVDLIASANRWWIREPVTCPPEALPGCATGSRTEERTVVRRRPFDGITALPTDIVVPLETVASSGSFDVIGEARVAGRDSYRIALSYREARPLVMALQAGGSWRGFDPLDRVELWIDKGTWFPLRFEVYSGDERVPALVVSATSFAEPQDLSDDVFAAPKTGLVSGEGFRPASFGSAATLTPSYTAGLDPYRAGRTRSGRIVTYANGMTWLKIERSSRPASPSLTAEQIELPSGWAYYQPADETFKRRIEILTGTGLVRLESNLGRAELIRVAETMGIEGGRAPNSVRAGGLVVRRADPGALSKLSYVELPEYLPAGYRTSAALVGRSRNRATATVYFRSPEAEYDGIGVRITQSPSTSVLPPSSEVWYEVALDGVRGRWSAERGELEWIDRNVYRAVAAPSFDLATALHIARSMK